MRENLRRELCDSVRRADRMARHMMPGTCFRIRVRVSRNGRCGLSMGPSITLAVVLWRLCSRTWSKEERALMWRTRLTELRFSSPVDDKALVNRAIEGKPPAGAAKKGRALTLWHRTP